MSAIDYAETVIGIEEELKRIKATDEAPFPVREARLYLALIAAKCERCHKGFAWYGYIPGSQCRMPVQVIRLLREAVGLGFTDWSYMLGTTPEAVENWENGVGTPGAYQDRKMVDILTSRVDWQVL